MITYNQEAYIKQAIESVLAQETSYIFELNIFNDGSTDKTDAIIREVISCHPRASLINYHLQEKNIGLWANYIYSIKYCKGEFVAICEGDDYWIDKTKLQKQVDFLQRHSDYHLCFHKGLRIEVAKGKYSVYPVGEQLDFNDSNFFLMPTIPMASVVFRNTDKIQFSKDTIQLDFNLLCSLLSLGKARMINEVMSVYRVHENAATFQRTAAYFKQRIFLLKNESKYKLFSKTVRKEIGRMYGSHICQLIQTFPNEIKLSEKLKYFFGFIFIPKTNGNYYNSYKQILKSIFS
jgi:glycosyltransferase involved in cell wall biosynthesis